MIVQENDINRLTPTQQAMLIYSLYAPESKAYCEQICYTYRGPLNAAAFATAWQRVIARHEILRTSFSTDDAERFSRLVHAEATLPFQQHDWRGLSANEQESRRDAFLKADCDRGFDLGTAPLIRVALLKTDDEAFWIVVSNHHIILDGWSMSLVRAEVSQFYQQLAHDRETDLKEAPDFTSYLKWLEQQDTQQAEKFWRAELAGIV
ncbi:MAG TPA: condensation domain-containing protein, partial [Pyrinomonadaceae bacterium]|nr:condensation domain-containing protein [Pyrinomonadaceae bacterium]